MSSYTCPEICVDCQQESHVLHIMTELGELWLTRKSKITPQGKEYSILSFGGFTEDSDDLADLHDLSNTLSRVVTKLYKEKKKELLKKHKCYEFVIERMSDDGYIFWECSKCNRVIDSTKRY